MSRTYVSDLLFKGTRTLSLEESARFHERAQRAHERQRRRKGDTTMSPMMKRLCESAMAGMPLDEQDAEAVVRTVLTELRSMAAENPIGMNTVVGFLLAEEAAPKAAETHDTGAKAAEEGDGKRRYVLHATQHKDTGYPIDRRFHSRDFAYQYAREIQNRGIIGGFEVRDSQTGQMMSYG